MPRRRAAAILGLLGAVLVGGVAQTFLSRWGLDGLGAVVGSQFAWVLLTFGVGWLWAGGRIGPCAAAGGLTGLALIASYYALQWVADGRHAATSQVTKTGGVAWTLAAAGGGAVMGLFGALAGRDARERPWVKAVGILTPAVVVSGGPLLWLWTNGDSLAPSRLSWLAAVFVVVGLVALVVTVHACGWVASVTGLALSLALGVTALSGLLVLQTSGWLYLTA